MANKSFNLIRERWIPCARLSGEVEKFSIADVLVKSHELSSIAHPSPIVPVSVLRMLLAILHRVFGPKNVEEWAALWEESALPEGPIREYLDQWAHRFRLIRSGKTVLPGSNAAHD